MRGIDGGPMVERWLVATTGLPYSGKSTFARTLAGHTGAKVIELDALNSRRGLGVAQGVSMQEWDTTFAEATARAAAAMVEGRSVVLDWVNPGMGDRRRWRQVAATSGASFLLVWLPVDDAELDRRANIAGAGRVTLTRSLIERARARYRPPGADEGALTYLPGISVLTWAQQHMPDSMVT